MVFVFAQQAFEPAEVALVHADDMVVIGIIRLRDATGGTGREGNAFLTQFALGRGIHVVADFFL